MKKILFTLFLLFLTDVVKSQQIDRFPIYPGCQKFMNDNQKLNGCFQENLARDLKLQSKQKSKEDQDITKEFVRVTLVVDEKGKMKDFTVLNETKTKATASVIKKLEELQKYNSNVNRNIIPAYYRRMKVPFKITFITEEII